MTIRKFAIASMLLLAAGCRDEQVSTTSVETTTPPPATQSSAPAPAVSVPVGGQPMTIAEMERQRFDENWRKLQSFRSQEAARAAQPAQPAQTQPAANITFAKTGKFSETMDTLNPATIDSMPVQVPIKGDVQGPSVLKTQVLLDRIRFSPGILDGRWGKNSEIAVYWFQQQNGITPTGTVDEQTFRALAGAAGGSAAALTSHTLTADDVKGPFVTIPADVYEKAKLDCMCYESLGEKLAEQFHTSVDLLKRLNPGADLNSLQAGASIEAPNAREELTTDQPANIKDIVVSVDGNYLHAVGDDGGIIFHAPTTVGSKYDPSPNETTKVTGISFNPDFHYQPTLFHEVSDTDPEAMLKSGANSPVGVVWMALAKPHFGIHGTSDPESIGYASSHGCIRLSNWDANDLAHMLKNGTEVKFTDTRVAATADSSQAQPGK
ncbi:MAG: L,D-transpeptidase family protein [Acidobacteriota bacterium]